MENLFNIKVNNFSGNIEYFFKLIKEKQINIINFNLFFLIDNYIIFLKKNLSINNIDDFASDIFLISYMIWIKSKLIIPKEIIKIEDQISEVNEDIKNFELKRKLIEYKKFKIVSLEFQKRKEYSDKLFSKKPSKLSTPINYNFDIKLLSNSFLKLIEDFKKNNYKKSIIQKSVLDPEQLEQLIINKLLIVFNKKAPLLDLVENISYSLEYLIAIFIAILNLAKKNQLFVFQNNNMVFIELINLKGE